MIKALLQYTSPGDRMIDDEVLYATIDAMTKGGTYDGTPTKILL